MVSSLALRKLAGNSNILFINNRISGACHTSAGSQKTKEMTDPIADFLTRIRNAYRARNKVVEIPSSKMKVAMTKILCEKGYILSYKVVEGTPFNTIKIALKYHPQTKQAAIKKIERISTPGLRKYTDVKDMPRVLNGLGIAIISTSKGVITDKEARDLNVGGEIVCYVY